MIRLLGFMAPNLLKFMALLVPSQLLWLQVHFIYHASSLRDFRKQNFLLIFTLVFFCEQLFSWCGHMFQSLGYIPLGYFTIPAGQLGFSHVFASFVQRFCSFGTLIMFCHS